MAVAAEFSSRYGVPAGPAPVVGHSDPNLANYLSDGAIVRIVDFEDAGISTVEYELASLVEHLASRDGDWSAFLARFDVDAAQLLADRRLTAALWLHFLTAQQNLSYQNPPDIVRRQAERFLALMA